MVPMATAAIDTITYPLPGPSVARAIHRIAWVDYAKGLGIILVVFGHVWRGLVLSHIIGLPTFKPIDRFVYSFHMPLFFVLSGLFLPRSTDKTASRFIADKCRTLAYPYFVWYFIQGTIGLSLVDFTNSDLTPASLVWRGITGGSGQFWFLYTLFFCSILFMVLRKVGLGIKSIAIVAVLLYCGAGVLEHIASVAVASVAQHFLYVALGATLSRHNVVDVIACLNQKFLLPVVSIGWLLVAMFTAAHMTTSRAAEPFVAILGTAAVVGLSVILSRTQAFRWIQLLGQISLQVFVAHVLATAGMRIALQRVLGISSVPAHIILGTFAGLAFPTLLVSVCHRMKFDVLFTWPSDNLRPLNLRAETAM
jgi:fucose 4-O-acetylase-like acetyltransferase